MIGHIGITMPDGTVSNSVSDRSEASRAGERALIKNRTYAHGIHGCEEAEYARNRTCAGGRLDWFHSVHGTKFTNFGRTGKEDPIFVSLGSLFNRLRLVVGQAHLPCIVNCGQVAFALRVRFEDEGYSGCSRVD